MVNINGKEWMNLTPADIESAISEIDFDESFYFELKDDRVSPKKRRCWKDYNYNKLGATLF